MAFNNALKIPNKKEIERLNLMKAYGLHHPMIGGAPPPMQRPMMLPPPGAMPPRPMQPPVPMGSQGPPPGIAGGIRPNPFARFGTR